MDKKQLMLKFQKDWKKYWGLDFLIKNGWKRQECKNCGKFFWSLVEQDICNDATCKPYEFLNKSPMKKKFTYKEAWKTIQNFFISKGHEPLKRYPVICRWYPLYFVIAGIIDFYRMEKDKFVFEFPKSPVILAQPSLRFNDISQVGISGRHWTCHDHVEQACLYDGKKGYWKDRCMELDFELLTKIFGINPELINFVEDVWLGKGAFGYSLESHIQGIELSNSVFTEFSGTPDNFEVMKTKVIDVGMGLERFAWLSQGVPTSYDAVLGDIIEKMKKKAGLSYDKKLFLEYSKLAGKLNLDDVSDLDEEMKKIAKTLKVDFSELKEMIEPIQAIYAIADHARTLSFALSDRGIPSNVGGGYNLRVVLRRSLNLINKYNLPFDLSWVIENVSKYFEDVHPGLVENTEHIKNILEIEEKKYKNMVESTKKKLSSLDVKNITEGKMIELYDSHGITPEMIKEVSPNVKAPLDFYTKITEKHMEKKKDIVKDILDVSGLPETELIYQKDVKKYKFGAKVLKEKGDMVILDKTCFYPRGGGQEPDHGKLNGKKVYDVQNVKGVTVHFVKGCVSGDVKGEIDEKRRKQIVKHHTGCHIINGATRMTLGEHIWQSGSKKDESRAHLDVSHYDSIDEKTIRKIEKLANKIIKDSLEVKKLNISRMEAEQKYGFRIYQGPPAPSSQLRIVEIPNVDVEACGGIHADNTKEIEEIFIISAKNVQDGVVRIEFVAGKDLVKKTKKEIKEEKEFLKKRYEIKKGKLEEKKDLVKKLKGKDVSYSGINYVDTNSMKELQVLARKSVKENPEDFAVLIGNGVVFGAAGDKCEKDIKGIVEEIAKEMGGSVGGSKKEFSGGGPKKDIGKKLAEKY